jgi:hypothetical protein
MTVRFLAMSLIGLFGFGLAAAPVSPPEVPANLKPPDTEVVLLKGQGQGQQIYKCSARADDATHFEWVLEKPQAKLLNEQGQEIGKHYAGPTWEASDGSSVVGQVLQRADAPQVGAVPWLLLRAKSTQGTGTFEHVTYIQRVATRGGVAPVGGCDKSHSGSETSVDYQADYYFYVSHAPTAP